MTSLLTNLTNEVNTFVNSGDLNLDNLLKDTTEYLEELKSIERNLEQSILGHSNESESERDLQDNLGKDTKLNSDQWYNKSIKSLKNYNSTINKFLKNILTNPQYSINLDDAYTYPLNIGSIPLEDTQETNQLSLRQDNQEELIKLIILHLLKIGQSDLIKNMIKIGPQENSMSEYNFSINPNLLDQFKTLNEIVDDILVKHDLTKSLNWFKNKYNESILNSNQLIIEINNLKFEEIEFKFHMLQFILLLNGNNDHKKFTLDSALEAYLYSKENFPKFYSNYLLELAPLMSLLIFKSSDPNNSDYYGKKHMINLLSEFTEKMKLSFNKDQENLSKSKKNESKFLQDILEGFDNIHDCQHIFINLSNEFISYYCKDMNLSNDSSLFQTILAGFINLPSFHKYNKIQRKLSKINFSSINDDTLVDDSVNDSNNIVAPYSFDLPFQLSDTNRFLFQYHPIFICPVSKEQLIPLTIDEIDVEKKRKRPKLELESFNESKDSNNEIKKIHNPVVILKHCNHVALKESVWQLSRRGAEAFKCHYCYKKHKFSEVSEAYFIDL